MCNGLIWAQKQAKTYYQKVFLSICNKKTEARKWKRVKLSLDIIL